MIEVRLEPHTKVKEGTAVALASPVQGRTRAFDEVRVLLAMPH